MRPVDTVAIVQRDAMSAALDRHLERSIEEGKAAVEVVKQAQGRLSKFKTLASAIADRRKAWETRADAILSALPALDKQAEAAFTLHENTLAQQEADFKEMEDAVRDLAGGNGGPLGG